MEKIPDKCKSCDCYKNNKCVRKDSHSNKIGICWMQKGQGEY